ncbi:MAG: hypothetical protein V8Q76_13040 [Bacteroides intestinalis]
MEKTKIAFYSCLRKYRRMKLPCTAKIGELKTAKEENETLKKEKGFLDFGKYHDHCGYGHIGKAHQCGRKEGPICRSSAKKVGRRRVEEHSSSAMWPEVKLSQTLGHPGRASAPTGDQVTYKEIE